MSFLDDESPQDQLKRLIAGYSHPAAPQTPVSSPPASPVALPNDSVPPVVTKPVSVPPVASGTEDLEKQEAANVATAHPVSVKPEVTPLAQQQAYDQSRLSHLQSSGAGEDRLRTGRDANGTQIMGADGTPKKAHPILGTIAKIGDIGLSSLFPTIAAQIPGTAMYHNRAIDNAQADVTADVKNEDTAATAAHLNAETANLQNPPSKDTEKWTPVDKFTDVDGTPLFHEQNSNQILRADGSKPTGFKAMAEKQDKPDSIDQQINEAFAAGNTAEGQRLLEVKHKIAAAGQAPERPERLPRSMVVLPGGKVVEIHPGDTLGEGAKSMTGALNADQITPATQGILQSTQPAKEQVEQLLTALEPFKSDNTPGSLAVARGKYAMGMASPEGELGDQISKLELDRVIAGARVLKGSSRAFQALELAMKHAPNSWVDSPQLMYNKLQNIHQNLVDTEADAVKFGTKGQTAASATAGTTDSRTPKMIRARDPQGKLHEAPEGSKLPAGWKAE